MYMYEITYSYIQDGRRVKETDVFFGDNAQEAVDTCRSENWHQFDDQFGRIERIYNEWAEPVMNWE